MSENNQPEPTQFGSGPVGKALTVITRFIDALTMGLNVVGTLLIVALVILISADVFGRTLFSSPVSGVPEMVSMSIVAIVFLQAGQTLKMGRMTRSEAFLNYLKRKSKRLHAFVEMLFFAIAAMVVYILLSASLPFFIKSWKRDTFVGTVGDFIAPIWPVKLILLIGASALLAQLVIKVMQHFLILLSAGNQKTGSPNEQL